MQSHAREAPCRRDHKPDLIRGQSFIFVELSGGRPGGTCNHCNRGSGVAKQLGVYCTFFWKKQ